MVTSVVSVAGLLVVLFRVDSACCRAPETYVLPEDIAALKAAMAQGRDAWFIKPARGSEGNGHTIVQLASEVDDVLKVKPKLARVAQRYIENPLLLHKRKFDLRIYICISSFDPLCIYVSDLGFAKLAAEQWQKGCYTNRSIHWANMAVNKDHQNFAISTGTGTIAESPNSSRFTHEQFKQHLISEMGADPVVVWQRIDALCVNAVLAALPNIRAALRDRGSSAGCFEMFGLDVVLDTDLKPWLLECNCGPSISSPSELDWQIKGGVLADVLNLVGLPISPPNEPPSGRCGYEKSTSLSPDQLKALQAFEDEQARMAPHLRRLYPTAESSVSTEQRKGMSVLDIVLSDWVSSGEDASALIQSR